MAKQHLYSRVPAKLSMYNRFDSFDTFAHSDGLTRDFIERELSCAYANKLSKSDMEAVRTGQMPPVYSQYALRSGQIVQTCTYYLPLDYTGERSAYLSHTLIPTEEEQRQLLYNQQNAVFNPHMFIQDVSGFDFTSPSVTADSNYPEVEYILRPVADTKELIKHYDPDTFKRFLSAIFGVLCAKGKAVYIKLDCPDANASETALKLITGVMTVIPFHLRKDLSFVTYVTDPAQYSHAKVKCLSGSCPEVPPTKGSFLDLHTGLTTGMLPTHVMESFPVPFFYSLLENATLRDDFLAFMDRAVKTIPALEKLSIKTLSDLVFLFCGANSSFAQQEILPTDAKVYDFLCVYAKYRSVLDPESRKHVYACLDRYPKRHEAIPKNIFAKLSRLYPDEPHSVKQIAIRVVLELLHTDIMRDKLLAFIKNNYNGEDADTRAVIHADLCRVYYGGFLQPQILSFFSDYFAEEAEATQDAVLEKILLTVRTQAVQSKILQFLRANYRVFTAGQRKAIYNVFFEMLPECDQLSALLIDFINEHVTQESPEQQKQYRQTIQTLILSDQKKAEPKLMPLLCKDLGFCNDAVVETVFASHSAEEIFDDYISMLAQETVLRKAETLLHISGASTSSDPNLMKLLIQSLQKLFAEDTPPANLREWLEADSLAVQAPKADFFASFFRETVIQPGITKTLPDILDAKEFPDGMKMIQDYAEGNTYLLETRQYKTLQVFWYLEQAVDNKDAKTVFKCLSLLGQEPVKQQIAARLQIGFSKKEIMDMEQYILYQMSISVLKEDKLLDDNLYGQSKDICLRQNMQSRGGKPANGKAIRESAAFTAERIFGILTVACQTNAAFLQMLDDDKALLDDFLSACCAGYGKGGGKWIIDCFADSPSKLQLAIKDSLDRVNPKSSSIFAKIFGNKR